MRVTCSVANYEHLGKVCWGNDTMRKLFDTEEARLERYPGVKYGWDNEAYTYDNLAEEDPALLRRMQELAKKYPGRIQIGTVSYGQPLSYYINGESNVRQLTQGIATDLEYFGVRPWIYIMSEHGMHAQIPQLIAQAGFRGAVMRTSFCMYGVNPEYPASCILWHGLDGTVGVPTLPTYPGEQCHCAVNGYSHDRRTLEFSFFGANTMDNKILLDYPVDAPWGGLEEFRDRFGGRIGHLVAFRADDPRQPEGIVAEYSGRPEYPWVLDEEILKAAGAPELDVHTGVNDFRVRMPWGLCGNWIWEKCRLQESRLYTLEALDALRAMSGAAAHPEALREAWKMLLICQHHDVQICGIEADARKCFARGDRALEGVEQDILGQRQMVRFNPLPWKRQDENGEESLSVSPMPPESETACSWDGETLSTPWYDVAVSLDGGFDAVIDKRTGRSVFLPGRRSGILAGSIGGDSRVEEGIWTFRPENAGCVLTDEGYIGGIPYITEWRFYDQHPRVDCQVRIEPEGEFIGRRSGDVRDPMSAFIHDEKLRMKFYPALPESAMGWRDQPFGVAETNRQSIECNYWAAVSDGDHGFALFNQGIQCAAREIDGAMSVPLAFSMYYVWSGVLKEEPPDGDRDAAEAAALHVRHETDRYFRDEEIAKKQAGEPYRELRSKHFLQGEYRTHLAFLPFSGSWRQAQLHRRALEYCHPCAAVSGETARLIRETGLHVDIPANVFLSSLYAKYGQLYLRLYEMENQEGRVCVTLYGRVAHLTPVDFFETPTGPAQDETLLSPCQVQTYQVTLC